MKPILFALLFFCSCKRNKEVKFDHPTEINNQIEIENIFKITNYSYGIISREVYDTIRSTDKNTDIYYFNKYLHLPYYLPNSLTSSQHKDTVITTRGNLELKELDEPNWTYTYIYDSLGHVINYAYSSCTACSDFAFNYILTYNSLGKINSINNTINEKDSYIIHYNKTNNIKKINIYSSGKLEASIAAIK